MEVKGKASFRLEAQGILVVPEWLGSMMAREIKYYEQLELVVRWPGGQEIR